MYLAIVMAKLGMPPVQTAVDDEGRQLFIAIGLERERTMRRAEGSWFWDFAPSAKVG